MLLEYGEVAEKKIHHRIRLVKKVELKNIMDPGAVAE